MKKRQFIKKIISLLVTFSLVISCSVLYVNAASGTRYEDSSNNTMDTADGTSNDYDNYGRIESLDDIDYWGINFAAAGMANFWLGEIPSGCNYSLLVYEKEVSTGAVSLLAASLNASNSQEFLRIHVKGFGDAYYYVRIASTSGCNANSYYKMRVKNTPNVSARYYTYDTTYCHMVAGYDTYYYSTATTNLLTLMDYPASGLLKINANAGTVYDDMPSQDITILASRGYAGRMYAPASNAETFLYAYNNPSAPIIGWDRGISDYSSSALSEVTLVIFLGEYTGLTSSQHQTANLVDQALAKGAYNAIGWRGNAHPNDLQEWLDRMFQHIEYYGSDIESAIEYADKYFSIILSSPNHPGLSRYYGNNNYLDSTFLK